MVVGIQIHKQIIMHLLALEAMPTQLVKILNCSIYNCGSGMTESRSAMKFSNGSPTPMGVEGGVPTGGRR